MKIFLDIGHPAHVHYFKNFIWEMQKKGHNFLISARDKEMVIYLLNKYAFNFYNRGKGANSLLGKLKYIIKTDIELYTVAKEYNPDLFLSFGSAYAAHVSKLLRKPHIAFDDTEHAILEHIMYVPFTDVILTPNNFRKNFGTKQLYFNGSMDLCYLHPNYFKPDDDIYKLLGLSNNDKYIFLRFVSWNASHDIGQHGFTNQNKIKAVETLSKYAKIFISSEGALPSEISEYKITVPYEKIHSVLYYSSLYLGESTSMATESATLGVPAICVNSSAKCFGVFDDFINNKLIEVIPDNDAAILRSKELLCDPRLNDDMNIKSERFMRDKIDMTEFMVRFIENYPVSSKIMNKNTIKPYKK